jgi:Sec-independent protein translocase protein TatA
MTDVLVVLIIVLIVVVVWRGPKTLPGIGSALGRGVKEARSEASKLRDGDDSAADPTAQAGQSTTQPPAGDRPA